MDLFILLIFVGYFIGFKFELEYGYQICFRELQSIGILLNKPMLVNLSHTLNIHIIFSV